MKWKKEIVTILTVTFLVLLLKIMNVLQVENELGTPFIMCNLIVFCSTIALLVQNNVDKNYQKGKVYYQNLDILKYICAIFIIILHLRPFLHVSNSLDLAFNNMITRTCVPIFFLITGYFVGKKEEENPHYIKDYIKKMIPLYLVWSIIYLPVLIELLFTHLPLIQEYISILPIPWYYFLPILFLLLPLILFIALIYTGLYYHLWYFPAIIFSLITLSKWKKKFSIKSLLIISFFLLLFGATETYYGVLPDTFQQLISIYYRFFFTTRNFLFFGLFYVVLGYTLGKKKQVYSKCCFIKLVLSIFFLIFEAIYLHDTKRLNSNILLSCIPLTYYLFICSMYLSNFLKSRFPFGKFSKYYYLIHPLVILIFSICFSEFVDRPYFKIFMVLGITHLLAFLLLKVKEKHPKLIL